MAEGRFTVVLRRYGLYFAWIVSLIATGGSLYLSEVLLFAPCDLCWFQRIFMYPQTIILGMASYRGDKNVVRYLLPINIVGGCISLYHYALQKVPAISEFAVCRSVVPCDEDYLNWYGIVTIPLLALIAFVLIALLLWFGGKEEA